MKLTKHTCLIAAVLAFALFGPSASAQCTPPGEFIGAGGGYEWIANGQPKSTNGQPVSNCWTLIGNVSIVSTPGCTYSTAKAFDMHYGARLIQEFEVPNTQEFATRTHWDLNYLLTMQDPNNDGWWNRLKATVYDVTTGRNLASQTYWGDDPDITCVPRDLTFTGNLAGHRLQVIFSDGSAYTDTVFRVRSISLIQN